MSHTIEQLLSWVVTAGAIAGGGALVGWLQRRRPGAENLAKILPVKIGAAKAGEVVRVVGRIEARGEILQGPITGRPCVAWEIDIRDRSDLLGAPLLTQKRQRPFALREATGVAHVERATCHLVLDHEGNRYTSEGRSPTEYVEPCPIEIERLLRDNDLSSLGETTIGPYPRNLVWREGVLSVGELATAVGRARWRPAQVQSDYRTEAKELILEPNGEESVTVTDDRAIALAGRGNG